MNKITLFSIITILFFSCKRTETYHGVEAVIRYRNLPTAQAIEEGDDYYRVIHINRLTKTKYEFFTNSTDEIDLDKCLLKVTKNCDIDKELAECTRLNLIYTKKNEKKSKREIEEKKGKRISQSLISGNKKEDLKIDQMDIPSDQKFANLSINLLTDSDIKNLSKTDLRLMRNEIFARHGYIFKSKDLFEHFSKQDWYTPLYNDVSDLLTDIERQNIELIKKHENQIK